MNTAMRELIAGERVKISLSIEIDNCAFGIDARGLPVMYCSNGNGEKMELRCEDAA